MNKVEYALGGLAFCLTSIPYTVLLYRFFTCASASFSTSNLRQIFNYRTLKLIGSSLTLSVLVAIISVCISVALLIIFWRIKSPFLRNILLITSGFLFCLSPVVHLIGWRTLPLFAKLTPLAATIVVLSWNFFPIVFLLLLAGLLTIEKEAVEAALVICHPKQVIRSFVIPHLSPVILLSGITVSVFTFGQMEVPGLLGYSVYPEEFLSRIILADDIGNIIWCALPYGIAAMIAAISFLAVSPENIEKGWQRHGFGILDRLTSKFKYEQQITFLSVTVMLIPIFLLFRVSGDHGYWKENISAILNSMKLGSITVLFSITFSYFIVDGLMLLHKRYQTFFVGIFCLQILLPGSLLGFAMVDISNLSFFEWLNTGNTLLITTHSLRLMPFSVLLIAGFRLMDNSSVQNDVKLMGISWIDRKRFLQIPCELNYLIIVSGILFILVMSELSSTIMVISPGTETIILRLYNLLHYGAYKIVIYLALMQASIIIMLILTLAFLFKRAFHDHC